MGLGEENFPILISRCLRGFNIGGNEFFFQLSFSSVFNITAIRAILRELLSILLVGFERIAVIIIIVLNKLKVIVIILNDRASLGLHQSEGWLLDYCWEMLRWLYV
jgi:hypothetical protein